MRTPSHCLHVRFRSPALVNFRSPALTLLLLVCGLTAAPARAQTAPAAAELDEIIVTAEKRSENLQNVPLSITAVTGVALEESGARTVSDISRLVPGLSVSSTGPGQSEVIVRGISSGIALSILGNVATVGYYLDETPVSDLSRNLDAALVDLERVEVLRGPQGTLYGTSSMGGAIRYISHKPDLNEFSARSSLALSHTDHSGELNREADGVVNIPLIPGKLAVRAAAFFQGWGGYIDRYAIDPTNYALIDPNVPVRRNVNSSRLGGARISVKFQPNDYLELLPSVLFQKTAVDDPSTIDKPPGSLDNAIQVRDIEEWQTDVVKLANLTATVKLPQFEIVSSTSYYDRVPDSIEDWSKLASYVLGEAPYPFYQFTRFSQKSWTEELRVSKSAGPLRGVVGVYYQTRNNGLIIDDPVSPGYNERFGTNVDTFFTTDETTKTRDRAAFTELNYDATSKFTITAGVRTSKTTQTHESVSDGYFNGGPSSDNNTTSSRSTTPKFGISYQATPDALLYATTAKGARPGGSQHFVPVPFCTPYLEGLGLTQAPKEYAPDSLWSYEIGSKNRLYGGHLVVNASAYYIDWKTIQQEVNLGCGFPIISNFGRAKSRGAELESTLRPMPGLTLSANAAYTEATAESETFGVPVQIGDPLLNTPKWAYGAAVDYTHQISPAFELISHIDSSYTSWTAAVFDKTNPFYRRPPYNLVNLNVGLHSLSGHWRARLFMDNVTNRHAETGQYFSNTGNSDFPPDIRALGLNRPRTTGIRAEYGF
ncbi:MAG: TonB-dependent receptor [Gammaproteobacteria bacterium]|nr:TonB-dependent receptor [Gammaproteobacteria bacterium]